MAIKKGNWYTNSMKMCHSRKTYCSVPHCETGTSWNAEKKMCVALPHVPTQVDVAPPPQCPIGQFLQNGKCFKIIIKCLDGMELINDKCVPPKAVCEAGFIKEGTKCIKKIIICRSGTTFNKKLGKCVRNDKKCG